MSALTNASDVAKAIVCPSRTKAGFAMTARVMQVYRTSDITELAVEDDTGGVIIKGHRASADVSPGNMVRAMGHFRLGLADVPEATFTNIEFISSGPAPQPQEASLPDIFHGRFDWRLVRIRGVIREVTQSVLSANWVIMILQCGESSICTATPNDGSAAEKLKALAESTVEIDCVCTPRDGSQRARVGRVLHFPGMEAVRITQSPPSDPYSAPDVASIGSLQPSTIATLGRHRASGRVLALWNGRDALLRAGDGAIIRVTFRDCDLPRYGDSIDVVGLPESDLHHVNLTDAKWRPSAGKRNETAIDDTDVLTASAGKMFTAHGSRKFETKYHGRTIHISGAIESFTPADPPGHVLQLTSDGIAVAVDMSGLDEMPSGLERGAFVSVTGVCVLDIENWRPRMTFPQVRGFFIVPRKAGDVRVLASPPWWTPARLLAVIGMLLAVIVAILIWNRGLKALANRKCRELLREQTGHLRAALKTEERTRLAVELHDSLAQNITGVSMEIEAALRSQDEGISEIVRHIAIADKALKSCRNELRNTLWDLRNQALDEKDMRTAIERTLRPHMDGTRLSVSFDVPRGKLTDNMAHDVLRIIRELTLNAIRHGRAAEVSISGKIEGDALRFSVVDDGCGFSPDDSPGVSEGHFGLLGIRERLDRLSGAIEFTTPANGGTMATVTIPINAQIKIRN